MTSIEKQRKALFLSFSLLSGRNDSYIVVCFLITFQSLLLSYYLLLNLMISYTFEHSVEHYEMSLIVRVLC